MGALIRAKVEYLAGHGRVFPVHPRTKAPLAGGWGGRNGSEVPRLKAKEVLEGLEAGAALGYKPSSLGLSVLDVDNLLEVEDWEDFQNLELEHPPLSWYESVSGEGAHMLYNFSEEAGNGGWDYDHKTLTGEVRSAKGYCVAPVPLGVDALYDAATMAFHGDKDAPFPVSLQLRAERPEKERKTVTKTTGTLDGRTLDDWKDAYEAKMGFALTERSGQWEGPCPNCGGTDRFFVLERPDGSVMVHCRGIDRGECDFKSIVKALFPHGGGYETETVDIEARVVNAWVVKPIGKAEFGKNHKVGILLDEPLFEQLAELEGEALEGAGVSDDDSPFRSFIDEELADEVDRVLVAQAGAVGIANASATEDAVVLLDAQGGELKREPVNGALCLLRVYVTGYRFEKDGKLAQGAKMHLVGLKVKDGQPEPLMSRKAAYKQAQAVKKQGKLDAFRKDFGA